MDLTILPGKLNGTVKVPSSKSQAHRALICAAFADRGTEVICRTVSEDIEATVRALVMLGAKIRPTEEGYQVCPAPQTRTSDGDEHTFDCGESGSTLRFMLPLIGVCGAHVRIEGRGRLMQRPINELTDVLKNKGMTFIRQGQHLDVRGALRSGLYTMPGNVSSQYISALLMALTLLGEPSEIHLTTDLSSSAYVQLTMDVMRSFGAKASAEDRVFKIRPLDRYHSPGRFIIEGDWSAAAFWIAAQALGSDICIKGVREDSVQADRLAGAYITQLMNAGDTEIDVDGCPDLLPILAVTAAASSGKTVFNGARRLRDKESDRLEATAAMLRGLGVSCELSDDTMTVSGTGGRPLSGGAVDAFNDHRIAMSAAIAATVCESPVTIRGAEAVSKSYPGFWEDFKSLGANII